MTGLRRIWALAFLTLAFAFGQQAVLNHDLGHAMQRTHAGSHDQHPGSDTCEKCPAFAQLASAVGSSAVSLALPVAARSFASFSSTPAPSRTVVSSRSRAPPSVL